METMKTTPVEKNDNSFQSNGKRGKQDVLLLVLSQKGQDGRRQSFCDRGLIDKGGLRPHPENPSYIKSIFWSTSSLLFVLLFFSRFAPNTQQLRFQDIFCTHSSIYPRWSLEKMSRTSSPSPSSSRSCPLYLLSLLTWR